MPNSSTASAPSLSRNCPNGRTRQRIPQMAKPSLANSTPNSMAKLHGLSITHPTPRASWPNPIAPSPRKSPSTYSPTPGPSASTNPVRSSIFSTNGPCAPASTPRKKSTRPPWTKSPNSAKSTRNSLATSARPATSAPASPPPSAPKARTSAASKSGSTSPTSPAASERPLARKVAHSLCRGLCPITQPCSYSSTVSAELGPLVKCCHAHDQARVPSLPFSKAHRRPFAEPLCDGDFLGASACALNQRQRQHHGHNPPLRKRPELCSQIPETASRTTNQLCRFSGSRAKELSLPNSGLSLRTEIRQVGAGSAGSADRKGQIPRRSLEAVGVL